jgi:hypothetical protein
MNHAVNTVYERLVPHQLSTAKGACPQGAELSKEHGSNTPADRSHSIQSLTVDEFLP